MEETLHNPWAKMANDENRNSFILKEEKAIIEKFNNRVIEKFKIHTDIFPAPFMGNVFTAPVMILVLNPGYDKDERECGYYEKYQDWWLEQIQHITPQPEFPLFCLDDEYITFSDYWDNKLKPLINIVGKKKVSENICKVQLFPYHSKNFKPLFKKLLKEENFQNYLPSQLYSFELVKKAMKRNAIIIIPRSRNHWFEAIPELKDYENKYFTNSYGNIILSKDNLDENAFENIIKAIE